MTPARWRVEPGATVDLAAIDPTATDGAPGDKDETTATFPALRHELGELHRRLHAADGPGVLLVLQAMDAGGKDGTVKHLFRALHPVAARVASFREPTEEELAHDFLWRVHRHAPARGEVVVFNRSHYEDVLVVRVHDMVPEARWRARYGHIRAFEQLLVDEGTVVVKVFLHISREEQLERFRSRLERPDKRWKFRLGDLRDRARWDDHRTAIEEAIAATSTAAAPWYVVPADHKWYRNWAVSRILLDALGPIAPDWPARPDLDGVVLE